MLVLTINDDKGEGPKRTQTEKNNIVKKKKKMTLNLKVDKVIINGPMEEDGEEKKREGGLI